MNKIRFKCIVNMFGEPQTFKRYGETEEQVRKELYEFIREQYQTTPDILKVEVDKTKTIKS